MDGIFRLDGAVKQDPAVDAWLNVQSPVLGTIAKTWFARIRQCGRDVRVLMHDGCPVACVKDGPFAYINVYKAHVNVGFFNGAKLPDPARLLQGNGKRMRHVKLKPDAFVDSEALGALIDAAYADIRLRLEAEQQ